MNDAKEAAQPIQPARHEAAAAHKAARARRDRARREAVKLGATVATLRRNGAGALQIEAARQDVRDAENRLRVLDVEVAMAERKLAAMGRG
jgi:hypothetical protein